MDLYLKISYYYISNLFAGSSRANLPRSGTGPQCIIYSSDEKDDLAPRPPLFGYSPPLSDNSDSDYFRPAGNPTVRNRRTRCNMFIENEVEIDRDASADKIDNDGADLADL